VLNACLDLPYASRDRFVNNDLEIGIIPSTFHACTPRRYNIGGGGRSGRDYKACAGTLRIGIMGVEVKARFGAGARGAIAFPSLGWQYVGVIKMSDPAFCPIDFRLSATAEYRLRNRRRRTIQKYRLPRLVPAE